MGRDRLDPAGRRRQRRRAIPLQDASCPRQKRPRRWRRARWHVGSYGARRAVQRAGRLALAQQPFAIFFDDFELLRNPVVLDLFKETLESLPAHGQAVLGARDHSRLNVGRWRATGRMVEIGPASLRFSATEARELLARKSGVALPHEPWTSSTTALKGGSQRCNSLR